MIAAPAEGSENFMLHPPRSNPSLVSSWALPCPCITPSRETCALAMIFLMFRLLVRRGNRRGEVNARSLDEGLANHIDPESCGVSCEGGVEALTGENMGRVFSRVRTNSGTPTL